MTAFVGSKFGCCAAILLTLIGENRVGIELQLNNIGSSMSCKGLALPECETSAHVRSEETRPEWRHVQFGHVCPSGSYNASTALFPIAANSEDTSRTTRAFQLFTMSIGISWFTRQCLLRCHQFGSWTRFGEQKSHTRESHCVQVSQHWYFSWDDTALIKFGLKK